MTTNLLSLTIDPGATLEVTSGELTTLNLIDYGTLIVDGDPPTFLVHGPVQIGPGGKVIDKSGTILFENGSFTVDPAGLDLNGTPKPAGDVVARGFGAEIEFKNEIVDNFGRIAAEHHGEVLFFESHVDNQRHAVIEADGRGSEIKFDRDHVHNSGRIEAEDHGKISFYKSHVENKRHGEIEANGWGSEVKLTATMLATGASSPRLGGTVLFDRSSIYNARGASIAAEGWGSESQIRSRSCRQQRRDHRGIFRQGFVL